MRNDSYVTGSYTKGSNKMGTGCAWILIIMLVGITCLYLSEHLTLIWG